MLKQLIADTDFSEAYRIESSSYFKNITSTDLDYWNVHEEIFSTVEKDAKILDIGTWFGIVPWGLQQLGYKDVQCTECEAHSQSKKESFKKLHQHFNISPFELHIKPQTNFILPEKYDVITITKTNLHWKTEQVVHYDGSKVNTEWQVLGADNKQHTFFSLYNIEDWEYLFNKAFDYLNTGGRLLINPEPAFDNIDYYTDTNKFLLQYKKDNHLEIKKG